jgi:hypothetical protein
LARPTGARSARAASVLSVGRRFPASAPDLLAGWRPRLLHRRSRSRVASSIPGATCPGPITGSSSCPLSPISRPDSATGNPGPSVAAATPGSAGSAGRASERPASTGSGPGTWVPTSGAGWSSSGASTSGSAAAGAATAASVISGALGIAGRAPVTAPQSSPIWRGR